MGKLGTWRILSLGMGLALLSAEPAGGQRYAGMRADGQFFAGEEIGGWNNAGAQPQLSGQQLLHPQQPFKWVVDQSQLSEVLPEAFVELVGGDRLPGEVVRWQAGGAGGGETLPDHLIVRPTFEFSNPHEPHQTAVRVRVSGVRRVVWQRLPAADYTPSTVFFRDGRRVQYRSLRWDAGGVLLLLDQAVKTVPFGELAEVHMPDRDPWTSYYEQLAVLTPACDARLLRLETNAGGKLTTSTERFEAGHHGDANRPESWLQRVQPAWSLDPMWLRYRTIRGWLFFDPQRVPLSLLTPVRVEQNAAFGSSWRWQTDQSAQQTPLRSGGQAYGWGFGVQGATRLEFALPKTARTFRTRIGLDQIVGGGGCVQMSVALVEDKSKELFTSKVLVGSEEVVDSGVLNVASQHASPRLALAVDALHANRPEGADPFDIRDTLDWLAPELDLALLKAEVSKRRFEMQPNWNGWQLTSPPDTELLVRNHWDARNAPDARYRAWIAPSGKWLMMSRQLKRGPQDRWLALLVSRANDQPATRVQVRLDGRAIGEADVPVQPGDRAAEPIVVPLPSGSSGSLLVEIVQLPSAEKAFVEWRGVQLLAERPGLLRVFEDDPQFAAQLQGEGGVTLDTENVAAGKAALLVRPPSQAVARFPGLNAEIRDFAEVGQYRFIRFAWRKEGGKLIGLGLAHDGQLGARSDLGARGRDFGQRPYRPNAAGVKHGYRYLAGSGDLEDRVGQRVDGNPPNDWQVHTHDLAGEFGNFTLTGLEFFCPDGEAARFDHIYLARTQEDFQHLPPLASAPAPVAVELNPTYGRQESDPWRYGELLTAFAPELALDAVSEPLAIVKEHRGKQNVLRTKSPDGSRPSVFRGLVSISKEKPGQLRMVVSHDEAGQWQLRVRVNGEQLHESVVNADTAKEGWAEVNVDLGKFAGQTVILEVHHQPHGGHHAAYWSRMEIAQP